jgi:ATP-binding cassette, subfamily B, bacterial PglK
MLKNNKTVLSLINDLWGELENSKKIKFYGLFFLTIVTGMVEMISLGAVVPFMGVLLEPETVYYHPNLQFLVNYFQISSPEELIKPMTIIFGIMIIISSVVRVFHLKYLTVLTFNSGSDMSTDVYKKTLYRDYDYHIKNNSSEIIGGITSKVQSVILGVMFQVLSLLGSVFILSFLLATLLWINWVITTISIIIFALAYFIISLTVKRRLNVNSMIISKGQTEIVKAANEGLGGIREILIDGSQKVYYRKYEKIDRKLRTAQGVNLYIGSMPRFIVESIGMLLIVILSYYLTLQEGGLVASFPILAALALGAQRILPLVQASYSSIVSIVGNKDTLSDVLKLINVKVDNIQEVTHLSFENLIQFRDVSYRYNADEKKILNSINLDIKKGEIIGLIGETGCGKSTMLDILMGLLTPTSGSLAVDNVKIEKANIGSWQSNIAHVPQHIFLIDDSIINNIALGVSEGEIDFKRVELAAKRAQIYNDVMILPNGFDTNVGERGVRLSGGQLQRIGIARALYKDASLLILDEATSALDIETEKRLINAIHSMSKNTTVIMIAHRLETLKICTRIIKISNGSLCN